MNPWESDPPAQQAQPWMHDEEAQKRFTYQPQFTESKAAPAPEKSWLQKAGDVFAMGQTPGHTTFADVLKDRSAAMREDIDKTEYAMGQGKVYTGGSALGFLGGGNVPIALEAMAAKSVMPAARTAAEIAHESGYVLPPAMASEKPGTLGSVLSAWGGKIKTAQTASVKNQAVTNSLAAKDLGLPADTMLTERAFEQARKPALDAYKAVENAGVPIHQDEQFFDDLLKLGPNSEEMAKYFPEMAKNDLIKNLQDELGTGQTFTPKAGVQAVRRLRYKASANLKDFANPDKVELGMAQRKAADALDDLIERNLSDAGKPDLVKDYRHARQLLAKSHDLESATNTSTGDVDARALARLSNKGRPLSGNSKIIADTANSFPRAMQSAARFGGDEKFSGVDAFASLMAGAQGRVDVLGAIAGRPLARELALSKIMQNRVAAPRALPPAGSLLSIMRPTEPGRPTFGP